MKNKATFSYDNKTITLFCRGDATLILTKRGNGAIYRLPTSYLYKVTSSRIQTLIVSIVNKHPVYDVSRLSYRELEFPHFNVTADGVLLFHRYRNLLVNEHLQFMNSRNNTRLANMSLVEREHEIRMYLVPTKTSAGYCDELHAVRCQQRPAERCVILIREQEWSCIANGTCPGDGVYSMEVGCHYPRVPCPLNGRVKISKRLDGGLLVIRVFSSSIVW